MIEITDKVKCCGCSACAEACPAKAIRMQADETGFVYPCVNKEKCVQCNLCNKICPILSKHNKEEVFEPKTFVCQNNDADIRFDSTSGGIFSALATQILNESGIVYGAALDENFRVKTIGIEKKEQLYKLRGSKYVQSDVTGCYKDVLNNLKSGRQVLFTGTPCQIEGLRSYLRKGYINLYLMDVVCYSISSPLMWEKYKKYLSDSGKVDFSKVARIKFRDKKPYGYEYTLMSFLDSKNQVLYSAGPESNEMLRSFVANMSTRPSCNACSFKKRDRLSDFTVWDCYNVNEYNKGMDDNKGTSHIMIQSEKGLKFWNTIKNNLNWIEVDTNKAVASEPAITVSASAASDWKLFMDDLANLDASELMRKYFPDRMKVKVERFSRELLSRMGIYKNVKRLIKSVRK